MTVSLPLNMQQADEIINKCESSFSQDLDVNAGKRPRFFSLDSTQFTIRNPEWERKLKKLTTRAGFRLGIGCQIQSKMVSLVIQKPEGSYPENITDTHNDVKDSQSGLLMVQLPSLYLGGELKVKGTEQTVAFNFGQETRKSAYTVHYAAFRSNLLYSLSSIKDGYRLMLIYSLQQNGGSALDNNTSDLVVSTSSSGFLNRLWCLLRLIQVSFFRKLNFDLFK
jgi:hypothetical protein